MRFNTTTAAVALLAVITVAVLVLLFGAGGVFDDVGHNPKAWSRSMAHALCEASKAAYQAGGEAPGTLIEDKATDTQARVIPGATSVILAFRGTESARDARTDARATRGSWKGFPVHEGFLEAYLSIRNQIADVCAYFTGDGQRVHVTGHSLGGALATLGALDLISAGRVRVGSVITFGSPRVFGVKGARWADRMFSGRYFRVINSNDIVPRVPRVFRRHFTIGGYRSRLPWLPTWRPFAHCGRLVLLTEQGETIHEPDPATLLFERIVGWRGDMARDHFLDSYAGAI